MTRPIIHILTAACLCGLFHYAATVVGFQPSVALAIAAFVFGLVLAANPRELV